MPEHHPAASQIPAAPSGGALDTVEGSAEQRPAVSIVVPTYNEAENLAPLTRRLDAALSGLEGGYEIVIVDDDSPDGTWRVGAALAASYPVHVHRRRDASGLATAVTAGFEIARAEHVIVMDADLQHPPERVPDLLTKLQAGADVVVGTRHADGGSMGDFGPLRRAVSFGADAMARTLFRDVRATSDLQSGFFGVQADLVADAELDPKGYKILLEVLVQGQPSRVEEVGYSFGQREAGESKLGVANAVAYLEHLASLAWRSGEATRVSQFLLVGLIGAMVNLVLLALLTHAGVHYLLAGALGIELGLLCNFALNRRWTFEDRASNDVASTGRSLIRDHAVRSGGIAINLGVLALLTSGLGMAAVASQAIGIGLATGWNFLGNTWWTWEA